MAICKWTYEDIIRFERALDEGFEYHRIVNDMLNLRVYKVNDLFIAKGEDVYLGNFIFEIGEQDINKFADKLSKELNKGGLNNEEN